MLFVIISCVNSHPLSESDPAEMSSANRPPVCNTKECIWSRLRAMGLVKETTYRPSLRETTTTTSAPESQKQPRIIRGRTRSQRPRNQRGRGQFNYNCWTDDEPAPPIGQEAWRGKRLEAVPSEKGESSSDSSSNRRSDCIWSHLPDEVYDTDEEEGYVRGWESDSKTPCSFCFKYHRRNYIYFYAVIELLKAKLTLLKGDHHFSRCWKCFSLLQREKWRGHP